MNKKAWKIIYRWRSLSHEMSFRCCRHMFPTVDYYASVGKTVSPEIGKLFCFSNKEDAKNYLSAYYNGIRDNVKILYGTAFDISYPRIIADSVNDFREFWELKNKKKKITIVTKRVPKGTICCKSFKVEEIYDIDFKLLSKDQYFGIRSYNG